MIKSQCPGHEEKCPFCKVEKSPSPYVEPITREAITNFCCRACFTNNRYIDRVGNISDEKKAWVKKGKW